MAIRWCYLYSGISYNGKMAYIHIESQSSPGPHFNVITIFPGIGILILKIRLSHDRLIFVIGNPILIRWHLYI